MDDVRYRGGFADVLRCECGGREVAVKALRPQVSLEEMRKASHCLRTSLLVLIGECSVEVLQRGHHLEISPASQRVAVDRGDHDRESICHGF